MGTLDPQVRAWLEELQRRGGPPAYTLSPTEARTARNPVFVEMGGAPEALAQVTDEVLAGPGGPLPLRVYTPEGPGPFPVLVYFHGGGWVIGNLDTHDRLCRALARRTPCLVVSVDYRLAPEHKFPAALEDAWGAVSLMPGRAAAWNGDPTRVAVGGDSAGGNLATVVARWARDRGGPRLVHQLLIYPVTDLTTLDRPSYRAHGHGYILTLESMAYYRDHYLPSLSEASNPDASPLLAEDLSGLPPATLLIAEYDALTDEGRAYATRLAQAGVEVTTHCFEGMIHAFFNMTGLVDRTHGAIDLAASELRKAFSRT